MAEERRKDRGFTPSDRLAGRPCKRYAHSFTYQKGLSYQIFELGDSGLPQQGILPISATKTTTKANHRCLEKDSFHCAMK